MMLAATVLGVGCGVDSFAPPIDTPTRWEVEVPPAAPRAVHLAADDMVRLLGEMGLEASRRDAGDVGACSSGVGRVVFFGDGIGEPIAGRGNDQTFSIEETVCPGGRLVQLNGSGLLGRQYAAYEWLHAIGVRFFHPEETHVPAAPTFADPPLSRRHTPAFRYRSVSLHLTHPLELGDAFRLGDEATFPEASRYIDWQVQNLASMGHSGIGDGIDRERGIERGFLRETGMSLHNTQQGGRPVVDPDSPLSEQEQIVAAIEERMGASDPPPDLFSFTFNPSEFTEIEDTAVVRQLELIGEHMAEHYPDTIVMTINHGTAGPPTPTYGVRYYDLPTFAPPNIGVKVHSLMFYDLFRPAPVYGNEDFRFLYDFMVQEYRERRIWHFPEAAWWLTFDNAVPLYLPITVEARDRDIQGIAFMLEGKLDGHTVFGTGHEWGYWQNEYCSLRMAADLDYRWRDCFRDIAVVAGEGAPELVAVLEEAVALQEQYIVYGEVLAYLVGTDPETEIAASIGVEFHPLPPAPAEIMRWDLEQVSDWNRRVRPSLLRMAADFVALTDRLRRIEPGVTERGRNVFGEILDGIEVTGLRAQHAALVYGAVVSHREGQLRFDPSLGEAAVQSLTTARATTDTALAVIHRREQGYRYRPLDRAIGGGPSGDGDDNWTIYPYRYLNRTHHGYYYTRIDDLVAEALGGGSGGIEIEDALLAPAAVASVRVESDLTAASIDWGDGSEEAGGSAWTYRYDEPGAYRVSVRGEREGDTVSYEAEIAQLADEHVTGFSGRIVAPMGTELIEPVLPAIVLGPTVEGGLAVGFSSDAATHHVDHRLWAALVQAPSPVDQLVSEPARLVVPIVNQSSGAILTSLIVDAAVVTADFTLGTLRIHGDLQTEAVIDALVAIGGFEPTGARRIVASTLGYTPETLPSTVELEAAFTLE